MADITVNLLRGLILSAQELKQISGWSDALIEDYLTIIDNLITLAGEIDDKSSILKNVTVVTSSPYTPSPDDNEIFVDTNSEPITIALPAGIDGTNYRILNIGSSGNNVTILPDGVDKLFGESDSEYLIDEEAFILTFKTTQGWY